MRVNDVGAPAAGLAAEGAGNAVMQTTRRSLEPASTVSLCNANFSRVSLGNIGEGASHA